MSLLRLAVAIVILVAAAYGGLTFYYGTGDPCEMLEKEQDGVLDELRRAFSREPTTRECIDELWREWVER